MPLPAATVMVRWAALGRFGALEGLESELTAAERERADRFLVEDARRRYVVGRGCLRRVLASLVGAAPREVPLAATDRGKPVLVRAGAEPPLAFNLSHSGDVVVAAFARCDRIGVDVEVADRDHEGERLARRFFAPAEAAAVAAAADPGSVFLHLWTAKEAWMKAVGEGLGIAPREVEVTPDPTAPPRLLALPDGHDAADWTLLRVPLPVPAVCTLALPAGEWDLDLREWWP